MTSYNYQNSGHYPSSCILFKAQRAWILSPSLGGTYSDPIDRLSIPGDRFHLKTETESSLQNFLFLNKMDNVQNCGFYVNVLSSQTYTTMILLCDVCFKGPSLLPESSAKGVERPF
jgi:hypothetical protein